MHVKFNDLYQQYLAIADDIQLPLEKLFAGSQYINGPQLEIFENNFAAYTNTNHCLGVSNGTDAIKLCVQAVSILKPANKTLILLPANTFIATLLGAKQGNNRADIKLIDCDEFYQIDTVKLAEVLSRDRERYDQCIILGVHLYGHCCDVNTILSLCEQYDCIFLEDSAQAHGTITDRGITGSIGLAAAFSFYPGKNLGACGDAGCITTNSSDIYNIVKSLRNLGTGKDKYHYDYEGYNHRMDTLQSIFLNAKLKYLDKWNEQRAKIADAYGSLLSDPIIIPKTASYCHKNTYHLYVVRHRSRDLLMQHLKKLEIETGIHYPIPIELTGIFNQNDANSRTIAYSEEILSLPIHPFMSIEDAQRVCEAINAYR